MRLFTPFHRRVIKRETRKKAREESEWTARLLRGKKKEAVRKKSQADKILKELGLDRKGFEWTVYKKRPLTMIIAKEKILPFLKEHNWVEIETQKFSGGRGRPERTAILRVVSVEGRKALVFYLKPTNNLESAKNEITALLKFRPGKKGEKYLGVIERRGRLYIATKAEERMETLFSIFNKIKEGKIRVSKKRMDEIVSGLARELGKLHAKNLLHGDYALRNLLFDPVYLDGGPVRTVKIDFAEHELKGNFDEGRLKDLLPLTSGLIRFRAITNRGELIVFYHDYLKAFYKERGKRVSDKKLAQEVKRIMEDVSLLRVTQLLEFYKREKSKGIE